jgi:3-oxoacyl-[acyl-carrier protein] reductase
MDVSGQGVVITGGEGSLAMAIAQAVRHPGWRVEAPAHAELDVACDTAVDAWFSGRRVDLLVCAAGLTRDAPLGRLDPGSWDEVWNVNFEGSRRCAEAVLPGMRSRGCGHVVFVSSYSALHPPPGQAAYAAAKGALLGLVRDMAWRHGPAGLRFNAVLPGFLETRMTRDLSPKRRAEVLADHALGRFNTVEAVAAFIRFLHFEQPHTSGQVFQLDSRPGPP